MESYEVTTSDNKKIVWNSEGTQIYSGDKLLEKFDNTGSLLKSWIYGADGSVAVYDSAGNLTGMTKKGAFTPAEAAAAVHDGNDNVVSITW